MRNSCLGCFSWRENIAVRVRFENLWSCTCTTPVFKWFITVHLLHNYRNECLISSSHEKGSKPRNKLIWRYNNSSSCVTSTWRKEQIPPLNFLFLIFQPSKISATWQVHCFISRSNYMIDEIGPDIFLVLPTVLPVGGRITHPYYIFTYFPNVKVYNCWLTLESGKGGGRGWNF